MTKHDSTISNNEKAPQPIPTQKKSPTPYLAIGALLLAVIALLCAGFTIYHNMFVAQERQAIQAEINTIKQQQDEQNTTLTYKMSVFKRQQKKLQQAYLNLNKSLENAVQQSSFQNQDWLLLKARYYLELAQINAHWSANLATTQALLEQADIILAETTEQKIFSVRQAIAEEISQIKTLPKVDTSGILSRLDAAQNTVLNIPIKGVNTNPTQERNFQNDTTWKARFRNSLSQLQKLVIIRHHDEDIVPLLSTEQASLIRENIRLNLQEAQWAVLQQDEAIYQLTLKQAIANIKRSFEVNAENTRSLLQQLQILINIKLSQEKPSIDQSLSLLNQIIAAPKPPPINSSAKEGDGKS
jgi:uroporphyrin-3 C-methyltransferase